MSTAATQKRTPGKAPPNSSPAPAEQGLAGLPVDVYGGPTIDPTANVIALQAASAERQDDLRKLNDRRIDAELRVLEVKIEASERMSKLRVEHQMELRAAEQSRLDSIRQVDREDVNKTQSQAQNAIATLAATANTTAETLRTQVATTAAATQNTFVAAQAEVNKRLSALELSFSEGRGKQAVESPMMLELIQEVKRLNTSSTQTTSRQDSSDPMLATLVSEQKKTNESLALLAASLATTTAASTGSKTGQTDMRQMIQWIVMLVLAALTIYGFMNK